MINGEIIHEYKLDDKSKLFWLSHASFMIKIDDKIIYIDPYDINETEKADIILITHSHYDHCSIQDIKKIIKESTTVVAPSDCISKIKEDMTAKTIQIMPFEKKMVDGLKIETVPAYNINKKFHQKQNNWVGYIINTGTTRVYHAGDTDLIPEMSGLIVDIALLPIGGTYTMDAKEAANACDYIKPRIAIPMHYNKIIGSIKSAQDFKDLAKCEVIIL